MEISNTELNFKRSGRDFIKEINYMAIILRLDRIMADRKMSLNELSTKVGVTNVNLSKIKTGKISAIRFSTLNAICDVLDCQPSDILEFIKDEKTQEGEPKDETK
jgi:putative transcriptional regulator